MSLESAFHIRNKQDCIKVIQSTTQICNTNNKLSENDRTAWPALQVFNTKEM